VPSDCCKRIAQIVGILAGSCHTMLSKIHKDEMCLPTLTPKMLMQEQCDDYMNIRGEFTNTADNPDLFQKTPTDDKMCFVYNPQSK
jgi:hypothetical protein